MKANIKNYYIFFILLIIVNIYPKAIAAIHVVAAENVYGNVVKELGGPYVEVINILNNPAQDPHLFSINPSIAKAVKHADIVVMNGANYDPWMDSIIRSTHQKNASLVTVASLMPVPNQQNPHLWYFPAIMPIFAKHMTSKLCEQDKKNCTYYTKQLQEFNHAYRMIDQKIKELKSRYQDVSVAATEPLFNYMALSIGLKMRGEQFQLSIMNDLPPAISDIQEFEDDLREHKVALLIYNKQVLNPLTQRMLSIAKEANIPNVGLSEMMPNHLSYVQWMLSQLQLVDDALKDNEKSHAKP